MSKITGGFGTCTKAYDVMSNLNHYLLVVEITYSSASVLGLPRVIIDKNKFLLSTSVADKGSTPCNISQ